MLFNSFLTVQCTGTEKNTDTYKSNPTKVINRYLSEKYTDEYKGNPTKLINRYLSEKDTDKDTQRFSDPTPSENCSCIQAPVCPVGYHSEPAGNCGGHGQYPFYCCTATADNYKGTPTKVINRNLSDKDTDNYKDNSTKVITRYLS